MKKILAILMCVILVCTFTVFASAEEADTATEGIVTEAVDTATEEIPTEVVDDPNEITVDEIVDYAKAHAEEISVIFSLIVSAIYAVSRNKKLHGSISTVNNNAVTMAENNMSAMLGMTTVVEQYKNEMASMLAEIRRNNEERAELEASLAEVSKYLKSTRLANVELANEVAELLVLANIPNSKKDELYSRHLAAVNAIAEAEAEVADTEVKENEETIEE